MPLPFLKTRRESGISTTIRPRDTAPNDRQSPESEDNGLAAAAEDLCRAIESKDYKGAAQALKAAFDILESQPHEEYSDNEEGQE